MSHVAEGTVSGSPVSSRVLIGIDVESSPSRKSSKVVSFTTPIEVIGKGVSEPSVDVESQQEKDALESPPLRAPSRASNTSKLSRHSVMEKAKQIVAKVDPLACTVMAAGAMLACCAGMTNAVALKALGAFVSHLTGTLSKVGLHAEANSMTDAGESLMLVVSFACGAAICGCLITKDNVSFGYGLYGLALMGNSMLLFLAIVCAESDAAPFVLAAACGLQNGTATSYSGSTIRTTHVTGTCTDIGLILGRSCVAFVQQRVLRRTGAQPQADCRKLLLLLILGFSFCLGVFLGAALETAVGVHALVVPAVLTGVSGAAYTVWRTCILHQALLSYGMPPPPQAETGGLASKRSSANSVQVILESPAKRSSSNSAQVSLVEINGVPAKRSSANSATVLQRHVPLPLQPLQLEDLTPRGFSAGLPLSSSSPREKMSLERLLEVVESLEQSFAALPASQPMPGTADLQVEAVDAHRRLRSLLKELSVATNAPRVP